MKTSRRQPRLKGSNPLPSATNPPSSSELRGFIFIISRYKRHKLRGFLPSSGSFDLPRRNRYYGEYCIASSVMLTSYSNAVLETCQSGRMDFTANEGSGLNSTGGSNPPVSATKKTPVVLSHENHRGFSLPSTPGRFGYKGFELETLKINQPSLAVGKLVPLPHDLKNSYRRRRKTVGDVHRRFVV